MIGIVMNGVQQILQRAVADTTAAAPAAPAAGAGAASDTSTVAASSAAALAAVRFRAAAEAQLSQVLQALAARGEAAEHRRLLSTIEAAFCSARIAAVLPLIQQELQQMQATLSLRDLARYAPRRPCRLSAARRTSADLHGAVQARRSVPALSLPLRGGTHGYLFPRTDTVRSARAPGGHADDAARRCAAPAVHQAASRR